jgi:glycosyltransferase involved in cell wall biosynthesis
VKVAVLHRSLNPTGGAERVCLNTIQALKKAGHNVILGTVEPTDWDAVTRRLDETIRPDAEVSLLPFRLDAFSIYLRLLTVFLAMRLRKESDLLIITHPNVLPVCADITYVHDPPSLLSESHVRLKYTQSPFWRAYFVPYDAIERWLVKRKWFLTGIVLTNSKFSQKAIRKYTGRNAEVLYPAADVERFMAVAAGRNREPLVVSCGRYSPDKNYELVLEVAARVGKRGRFVIVGASSGKISNQYYKKLDSMKTQMQLNNVKLYRGVSFGVLLDIYARAKVFLHAIENEHFGIAVIEAIAAGLIPVVHRSGGPWEDILQGKQGTYGYSFLTADEASQIITGILDGGISEEMQRRNIEYASSFSSAAFEDKLLKIISSYNRDV